MPPEASSQKSILLLLGYRKANSQSLILYKANAQVLAFLFTHQIFPIFAYTVRPLKIYLTDQTIHFERLLAELSTAPVMPFNKSKLKEKTSLIALNTTQKLDQLNLDFLFDYQIFPTSIMSFKAQWQQEQREMSIGDTILQQVFIPPTQFFSQKIIFGVKINSIILETTRKGFSYETIEGHVEKGESTFTIEETGTGLIFKIKTFSEPGNLLTKLVAPIFSLPYQTYCTNKAMENVKQQIEMK